MIATVKKIEFNTPLGAYKVTKLIVDKDGEEKSYSVFTNAPFHKVIQYELKVGDTVELKMEKKGKYWNLSDVQKLQSAGQVSAPPASTGGSVRREESSNKDLAIARAVALKAGVELYCSMIAAGMTKKGLKPEAAVEEVFSITKKFEGYATLQEDISDLVADTSSIKAEGGYFEETPFE